MRKRNEISAKAAPLSGGIPLFFLVIAIIYLSYLL
jgi:hypothetical protein